MDFQTDLESLASRGVRNTESYEDFVMPYPKVDEQHPIPIRLRRQGREFV